MERRRFLHLLSAAGIIPLSLRAPGNADAARRESIDRRTVVDRHAPVVRAPDPFAVLSVGNGGFAFTADVTGMQSFPQSYREIPLAIQSDWGWHSFPNPSNYTLADTLTPHDTPRGPVPYADLQHSEAGDWLRQNPHRLSLANIGFDLRHADGSSVRLIELQEIEQRLDLWNGILSSRFRIDGVVVRVETCAHPALDAVAFRIQADSLNPDLHRIRISFPYGSPVHTGDPAVWTEPDRHESRLIAENRGEATWQRTLDQDGYVVRADWSDGESLRQESKHEFLLAPEHDARQFDLVVSFAPDATTSPLPSFDEVRELASTHWHQFWSSGSAIDLSKSTDPRWRELERRIVLSEYLTAIQCAGTMPPQETGLTFNSWHGKSHLEMHWWHGVHFALWGRISLLERSLAWYEKILPRARETARMQGYDGVRWPKMVGPDGRESPSKIGVFLIWQQPHPIYYAELMYGKYPERAVLETYRDLVFETARFMASYPYFDATSGRYVLGPPLIPAQEIHAAGTTINPAFELSYWRWGLQTAQRWRERLGLPRDPDWQHVIDYLSPLPMQDGLYVSAGSDLQTHHDPEMRRDHPTLLAPYGFIEDESVDPGAMRRTLERVFETWNWEETWGWDYPLVAMTAARVGAPELAIDVLLMDTPKNHYHPNGHNYQRPGLTIYLPGNGGLLSAIALMAGGWEGASGEAPGFPEEGWNVIWDEA